MATNLKFEPNDQIRELTTDELPAVSCGLVSHSARANRTLTLDVAIKAYAGDGVGAHQPASR